MIVYLFVFVKSYASSPVFLLFFLLSIAICFFRHRSMQPRTIVYGVVDRVDVVASVENIGEAAYQSEMKLNFTSDLQFIGVEVNKVRDER